MITSKVTRRGQTTIPRRIRDVLQVKPGQSLVYELQGDRVLIRSAPGVLASFGALKRDGTEGAICYEAARAEAREQWAAHAGQEGRKR